MTSKSLLILMLVLGLASAANANLLISVNGVVDPPETEVTLTPSQTAVIDIMGDGRATGVDFFLIPDATGNVSNGVMLYPGNLSSLITYTKGDGICDWLNENGYPGAKSAVYMGFGNVPDPMPLDGKLVDEIIFHCVAPGDSVLTLVSADLTTVEDIQIIHNIPEPMTIALLGLGGLALRRKSRT
jgi:hypothetical protein